MNAKTLLALLTVVGSGLFAAQESDPQEQKLRPVPQIADLADGWARDLRAPELETRRRAYEEALAGAARSPGVRETVENWAAGEDLELAWTAQLLLRELDRSGSGGGALRGPWHRGFGAGPFRWRGLDTTEPEELFRQLDSLFEAPLGGFLFEDWPGGRWRSRGVDPHGGLGGPSGVPDPHDPGSLWSSGGSSSQGLSLQMGPDGVRVEVRESEDGNEKVRTYEAESMDALLEAHPELRDRLGEGPGNADGFRGLLRRPFMDGGRPPVSLQPSQLRTDRLGVQVSPVEEGGLRVMGILPGSLGEALGLELGSVLTKINGVAIEGVEDVLRMLGQRSEDAPVEVEARGVDGERTLHRWEPELDSGGNRRVY